MHRGRLAWLFALFALSVAPHGYSQDRVVAYEIRNGREIPDSLTGRLGDWRLGRQIYFDRGLGGCSGCHGSPGGPGAQPDIDAEPAPKLTDIAARMGPGTIRMWLVAPFVLDPAQAAHGYYTVGQRDDPQDPRFGETLLTAEEIEGLVAYLMRQTGE